VPTSKIYLAMEKLAGLGLVQVQPTRPKMFAALPAEVVVSRIEWEQHAHASIRIGVQHDEVSILRGLDVDTRAVAGCKPVVIDLNRYGRRSLSEREQ